MQNDQSPTYAQDTATAADSLARVVAEEEADAAMFDWLRELGSLCGDKPNKHDVVTAQILGCLAAGLNTRKRIVSALRHLGHDNAHINIILDRGTGNHPERHHWYIDDDQRYTPTD